jgi:UDP-N-acetylmuramoylalanine--D-glutamate ligase
MDASKIQDAKHSRKDFFKDKKITVMGLGLLGRGLNDVKFLAECGAELVVTDLKSASQLRPSLEQLKKYKNIAYVLGRHRRQDFKNRDMILKAAGVPLDSPYIAEAKKNNIPIEMDASLFARLVPGEVTIIGVTGTRGKSTTTQLIYDILRAGDKRVYLGGNVRGMATLPLLKKVKGGDFVVMELDSWQLQGFGEARISPHIAVFTNFLDDHLNYYKGSRSRYFLDKANIFKYQNPSDCLVVGRQVADLIWAKFPKHAKRMIVVDERNVPKSWKPKLRGEHNRANIAFAVRAGKILKIRQNVIKRAVEDFTGIFGRLELVRSVHGIEIYNDTCATTPDATLAALRALGDEKKKNIVLIIGGYDKGLNIDKLVREIPKYCKSIILLAGGGTDRLRKKRHELGMVIKEAKSIKKAVEQAFLLALKHDTILFSPAFASFGMFSNEYDRGEQFVDAVRALGPGGS